MKVKRQRFQTVIFTCGQQCQLNIESRKLSSLRRFVLDGSLLRMGLFHLSMTVHGIDIM